MSGYIGWAFNRRHAAAITTQLTRGSRRGGGRGCRGRSQGAEDEQEEQAEEEPGPSPLLKLLLLGCWPLSASGGSSGPLPPPTIGPASPL